MSRRKLLLCFDAFGTLFKPKRPIAQQYGEVARSLGLGGFTDEQVQASFRAAFKHEAKENPNYGKANGMNASNWWTNIIHNTFKPLVGSNTKLPRDLAPCLLYRFSSEEAYELLPGALPLLQDLRNRPPHGVDRVAVGVITNSDDRVPSVLTSLGLRVSPRTYGSGIAITKPPQGEQYDIDFTVMSYDVGYEKPDKRVFAAAEELLATLPVAAGTEMSTWDKVYVGDDYHKDVLGARNAGWHGVLLREGTSEAPSAGGTSSSMPDGIKELGQGTDGELLLSIKDGRAAVGIGSFRALTNALGLQSNSSIL